MEREKVLGLIIIIMDSYGIKVITRMEKEKVLILITHQMELWVKDGLEFTKMELRLVTKT